MDPAAALEEDMQADFTKRVREAQPRIAALIEEITGWKGQNKLADFIVELILTNQGNPPDEVRPPCWRSHIPMTLPELTEYLMASLDLPKR